MFAPLMCLLSTKIEIVFGSTVPDELTDWPNEETQTEMSANRDGMNVLIGLRPRCAAVDVYPDRCYGPCDLCINLAFRTRYNAVWVNGTCKISDTT